VQGDLHLPDHVFSQPTALKTEGDIDMKADLKALARMSALLVAAALAGAAPAHAQTAFPSKTITIVVPTAAGGGNDAMARTIGQKLGPLLGQTIIIDNRAGANGSIASENVARATPDGHTLMLGYIATHSMNPALQKLKYDPLTDFEPIGLVGYSPTLMVANTGVVMLGVPYKGSAPAPAVSGTIGGQTQFMFPSLFTALPHVKSGKLKALAVAGPKRSPLLPDVPTLKEAGVDGVDVQQWYGIFAPAKTPKAIVDKLNKALNEVLTDREIVKRMEEHGADVETSTPEQLGALLKTELVKWKRVVQSAKLTAD
jgi:tripartite-type tricarboxylate transporter receptor subunit TctC